MSERLSAWLVFIHVIIPLATPGDYRLNNIQPNTSADCLKRRPLVDSSIIHSVCCGLQMFHVNASFLLLSLSGRITSSQSTLSDHRPMFVLVSLFLVCIPVFIILFAAEYHNVLMCFSLCGQHKTNFSFSGCLTQLFPLHQFSVAHQCLWYEKSN